MNAIDFKSFSFDGKRNDYNGMIFTIQEKGPHYFLDFFIQDLPIKKKSPIKITMKPDINHNRPHIHISRGHQEHIAAISLDGQFLNGENKLKRREEAIILDWVASHATTLKELWDCAKAGRLEYQEYVKKVNSTWEYGQIIFDGEKPSKISTFNGIIIWYDGVLSTEQIDKKTYIQSSGKMCVLSKIKEEDLQKRYQFESIKGGYQIKYGIEKD